MAENNSFKNTNRQFKKQTKASLEHHNRIPRQPKKPERGDNILYVCSKTNVKAQLEKCNKLLLTENEVIIYCMGAAIQRGILLALQICEQNITCKINTNTLTTELIDDLEPAVDEADYEIQKRFNSALRIRIFKTDVIESN